MTIGKETPFSGFSIEFWCTGGEFHLPAGIPNLNEEPLHITNIESEEKLKQTIVSYIRNVQTTKALNRFGL